MHLRCLLPSLGWLGFALDALVVHLTLCRCFRLDTLLLMWPLGVHTLTASLGAPHRLRLLVLWRLRVAETRLRWCHHRPCQWHQVHVGVLALDVALDAVGATHVSAVAIGTFDDGMAPMATG